jgi:hypothetical protein
MKDIFWKFSATASIIFLASCATETPGDLPKEALPVSYHAYNPPKGDPQTNRDWRRYGPGSIIRTPSQTQYVNASVVIGSSEVENQADPQNWTPITMRKGSVEQKVLTEAAAKYTYNELASAGVSLEALKELKFTYEFGKTWEVQIPEQNFFQLLQAQKSVVDKPLNYLLKNNQAHIIQGVLVTNSLTATAKDSNNKIVDFKTALTGEQIPDSVSCGSNIPFPRAVRRLGHQVGTETTT